MTVTMPESVTHGRVIGRFILAVGDTTADPDSLPDVTPASGTVTFTPVNSVMKVVDVAQPTTVIRKPISGSINSSGELVDPASSVGVWLVVGVYKVSYELNGVALSGHDIEVLATHTQAEPLDLTLAIPPGGPVLTASQYAELSARIDALPSSGGGATTLDSLTDVNSTTAIPGQALLFDGTNWVPGTVVSDSPVDSVNGQTGDVVISTGATSLDELSDVTTASATPGQALLFNGTDWAPGAVATDNAVDSVNGETGAVVLNATDVGAIPSGEIMLIDVMTQAEYDALPVKVATTLYVIQG